MNKNMFLITVALVSGLFAAGCNKSGKLGASSTFTPPAGPIELKVKWPPGEQVVQSMEQKMTSEISLPGQTNSMKQDMTMGQEFGLKVLKEDANGGHELEMEFLSMRMTMSAGNKTMVSFDSTKKSPGDAANPMAAMFKKIIGARFRYFLDVSNRVERIEGIDELAGRLTTGGKADSSAMLKSMFSEDYFKQIMDSSRYLPSKPVQPGDTWPIQMEIPMATLGILKIDYTVTFQSWEQHGKRTCARLEFQGSLKSSPDPDAKPGGMSMSISDGDTSGVSWFDPELGMAIDTTMTQNMNMSMTLPVNPRGKADGKMQTIASSLKQEVTIKLESVK